MATAVTRSRRASARALTDGFIRYGGPVVVILIVAGTWVSHYTGLTKQWSVMTDELQVERLAIAILHEGALWPTIHGYHVAAYSQLYPLLSSPFYLLPMPAAWHAVHVFNAFLMASTCIPVYLTARLIGANRLASTFAAAATALVPWMTMSMTLLTEVAAYPAFAWAIFLVTRALTMRSARSDLLGLVGLALAVLARTQFAVLVLLVPVVWLIHVVLFRPPGPPVHPLRRLRDELTGHRVLAGAYALALAFVAVRMASGHSINSILGNYAATASGDLLPPGIARATVRHFNMVVVGAGYIPLVLGGAWALHNLVRPQTKAAHVFAAMALVVVPVLTLEVSSFDIRFTPGGFIQDRYLFYIVPMLFICAFALLSQDGRRWPALLVSGAVAGWLVGQSDYAQTTTIVWASPAVGFHRVIEGKAWQLGHTFGFSGWTAAEVLRWGTIPLVVAVGALLQWRRRGVLLVAVGILLCGFLVGETRYVLSRISVPFITRYGLLPVPGRNWVDRAVPAGTSVGLFPGAQSGQERWWETELWNKTVDRVYTLPDATTFTPFPADILDVKTADGRLRPKHESPYLVTTSNEVRLGFEGARVIGGVPSVSLIHVDVPYKLAYVTRQGLYPDGWTIGGKDVVVDVFAAPGGGRTARVVELFVSNLAGVKATQPYTVSVDGTVKLRSKLPAGQGGPGTVTVCPPPNGHSRLVLRIPKTLPVSDGRPAGLHLDAIVVKPARSSPTCT
ncbi:MAG: hypothetical protein QOJ29_1266 [Thermoleophilaceae bacterium]|nr:hypothetical protein [Thermoleophilaceae bacterium]